MSGFWASLLGIYEIKTNTFRVLKKQPSPYLNLPDQDQRETNVFKKYFKTEMILFITFQKHYDLCDGNVVQNMQSFQCQIINNMETVIFVRGKET